MKTLNALNQTDGYKVGHRVQYPENTELVYSNWTPRSLKYMGGIEGRTDEKVVVFGTQAVLKKHFIEDWDNSFFFKSKAEVLAAYKRRIDNYLGPDAITCEHIAALHDLGYLPVRVKALPEGSLVRAGVPTLTIENTLPEFFWVTNFLETILSSMSWKMYTSASIARNYRNVLEYWCDATGGNMEFVPFQGHDFSFRGMGPEDAARSGAGHLLSFVGTDTIPAIDFLEELYGADCEKELVGCSVPATEHSVMSCGGVEDEIETFTRLITEVYPTGIVSIVSDTWDYFKILTDYLPKLKAQIVARDGKVVIRPDSGDPADIICGTNPRSMDDKREYTPEEKGSIQLLWETFDGTMTDKGYIVLDPHIGLIYGDSITLERAHAICARLAEKGFASTNVVFGIGSYTYQMNSRDTQGWAMKATAAIINGEHKEIFKDPKTDDGLKKSARGFLRVELEKGEYVLYDQQTREEAEGGELREVFVDGELIEETSLAEIRERVFDGLLYN